MKTKKKVINEINYKNQGKIQKKQAPISKKSPVKVKSNQHQNPFLSSLDSNSFHPFKNVNSFYGKKTHLNDLSQKKDSNQSSTHCSINNRSQKEKSFQNRKKLKKTRKNFQQLTNEDDLQREIDLSENQVMNLINSYAVKIQRQWRRYWFRKCLSFIILKEKQRRKYEQLNHCYESFTVKHSKEPIERLSCDLNERKVQQKLQTIEQKRRSLPKLNSKKVINETEFNEQSSGQLVAKQNTSSVQNQVTEDYFNSKKYGSLLSFQSLSKQDILKKAHQRTSSLEQKIISQQKNRIQTVEIGLNCSIQQSKSIYQPINTPISDLRESFDSNKKISEKKSHIKLAPKVYEFHIVQTNNESNLKLINQNKKSQDIIKPIQTNKIQKRSPRNQLTSLQNLKSNYDIKFPSTQTLQKDPFGMNKMFTKCKKVIEKQVTKKIQTISKHYQDKQITQRTYKNLINQTQQKLKNQMKSLQIKEGTIKNSWREVYDMFKEYVKQNSFQHPENKNASFQDANCDYQQNDHEVSFDKWDFQSSAKKSISQLQSFEDFARQLNERNPQKLKGFYFETKRPQNNHKTIQKVLDQLDKLQSPGQLQRKSESQLKEEESVLSILEQFRQRQRSTSFQKKSQHMLVENIPSQKQIKSSSSLKNMQKAINQNNLLQKQKNSENKKIEQLQNIRICEAKKELFEFSEIRTPRKSNKDLLELEQIQSIKKVLYQPKVKERLNTDESQEDSEVEMKITSIRTSKQPFYDKKKSKTINQDKGSLKYLDDEINKRHQQEQKQKQQQELKEKQFKQRQAKSQQFIQTLADCYFQKKIISKRSQNILQLSKVLTQVYIQKKRKKQLQAIQLKKYPQTIDPQIDAINNWLLQISHHLLDNHNAEIKKNLLTVKQLPKQEMLQISHSQNLSCTFFHSHPYISISQKIFKEFQFFYIKNVASSLQIEENHEQNFQSLLYAFHRCLIDCMNLTLLDELSIGKNWVVIPWTKKFKYRKNQVYEHSKQCLQRAINKVSGWAEYNLAQLTQNSQISPQQWKQYQEEKINLVIRQQILEYSFDNDFIESHLIMEVCQQIYEDEIKLVTSQFLAALNK